MDVFTLHDFFFHGISFWAGYGGNVAAWAVNTNYWLLAGPGDGSDGQFDNRTNPEDPRVVSPVAHVIKKWNKLYKKPA